MIPIYPNNQMNDITMENMNKYNSSNLVSLFNSAIGVNARNEFMSLSRVGDILIKHFENSLKVMNTDHNQLAVFDPFSGSWSRSKTTFNHLVQILKPTASNGNVNNIASKLAAYCETKNAYLNPYDGSRYVLFSNGMLDVKTYVLFPLSQADVLSFVSRNRINLNYKEDLKSPSINDWDPQQFLNLYTGGDEKKEQMLLFTLALALFPNHGFGVNVNYVGGDEEAVNKLKIILKNLLDSNLAEIPLGQLDDKFSLTNYNTDLSSIWANGNGYTNLSNLVDLKAKYNTLATGNFHLNIKNEKDVIFEQSPQLYVTSQDPVHDTSSKTSTVAINTLYYMMPEIDIDDKTAILLAMSDVYLKRTSVMRWLVWKMIAAYYQLAPKKDESQFSHFYFKANNSRLISLFPKEYKQWQKDALAPKNKLTEEVNEFIRYNIIPNLSTEFGKPTMMHRLVAYKLFKRYYNLQHGVADAKTNDFDDKLSPNQLEKMLKTYLNQNGYSTPIIKDKSGNPARRIIPKPSKMNFNFDAYIHDNGDPNHWFDDDHPVDPFERKLNGWFQIYPTNKGDVKNG